MSKSLLLGNGKILVALDDRAQVKDFYFPYVGFENHVGTWRVHKIGVFVDGAMHWLSDPRWNISINYQKDTFASSIQAVNTDIGIALLFEDVVYNEKDIFIRTVTVTNVRKEKRTVKIFFNQQFEISGTHNAMTAYYDPDSLSVIHYKGRRVFQIGGANELGKSFDEYSIGLIHVEGREGTWKDAEDGVLSKNPIEHGSVDSVIGFTLSLAPSAKTTLYYWVTVAESIRDTILLQEYLLGKTPEHAIQTTGNYWHAWINKIPFTFPGLSPSVVDLFKKSLFIIRAHADNNGAIIASGDSNIFQYGRDTYNYMWPRDGAIAALALDRAGYRDSTKRFFEFLGSVLTDRGYLLHKYLPDKSQGSSWHPWIVNGKKQLAIQEDETALPLWALWEYYKKETDLEFIEAIYYSFIKKSADFLMAYRDEKTGLPLPSYDLWEERYGVSTWTAASVCGALKAAKEFALLLGKKDHADDFEAAAESIKQAIIEHLYDKKTGVFYKMLVAGSVSSKKMVADETLDASSFYGVFCFGIMGADDPRLSRAYSIYMDKLTVAGAIGGVARYVGDAYYAERVNLDRPGNPWFITTLWFVQYEIACAKSGADFEKIREKLAWVVSRALPSGMLSEQLDPLNGTQLSVSPLTWSHAEYVLTIMAYLEKLKELEIKKDLAV